MLRENEEGLWARRWTRCKVFYLPSQERQCFHFVPGEYQTVLRVSENSCKFFLHLGHKAGTRKGAAWWLGSLLHPNRKKRWAWRRQYRRSSRKCSCLRLTLPSPIPAPVTCPRCCWDLLCRQQIENGLLKFVSFNPVTSISLILFFFFSNLIIYFFPLFSKYIS